ncbi:MAG TPA: DUF3189 family protein [Firmicutes bacterium]|nr:DUF3189 family protein [Bacillota bacterium]
MKVIYYCYGGAHSSVIAAAIHLRFLPRDRIPTIKEILDLPHFDKADSKDIGQCIFMGNDVKDNQVYIMGMGSSRLIVRRAILSILAVYGHDARDLLMVDALSQAGLLIRIGGITSKRLRLVPIGRFFTALGIRLAYHRFLRLVEGVESSLGRANCAQTDPSMSSPDSGINSADFGAG